MGVMILKTEGKCKPFALVFLLVFDLDQYNLKILLGDIKRILASNILGLHMGGS